MIVQENGTGNAGIYGGVDPRLAPTYSVNEVAHHLGLPPSTVRSWVKSRGGSSAFQRVIIPADGQGSLLSFQNLTEVHVLSALRSYEVPLPKIRDAIGWLREIVGTPHPLADVEMQTDSKDVFARLFGTLVLASKKQNASQGQIAIAPVLARYLSRIDRKDGALRRLYPFLGDNDDRRIIAIDPLQKFGKPYLVDVGVETSAVASRFRAGESIDDLAKDFDATEEQISGALHFERAIKSAA